MPPEQILFLPHSAQTSSASLIPEFITSVAGAGLLQKRPFDWKYNDQAVDVFGNTATMLAMEEKPGGRRRMDGTGSEGRSLR